MTDQHPLTDEIIHREFLPKYCYTENDLRLAADWQLEQVIEWLKSNLHQQYYLEYSWDSEYRNKGVAEIDVDSVVEDLREAMRPTTPTETP